MEDLAGCDGIAQQYGRLHNPWVEAPWGPLWKVT